MVGALSRRSRSAAAGASRWPLRSPRPDVRSGAGIPPGGSIVRQIRWEPSTAAAVRVLQQPPLRSETRRAGCPLRWQTDLRVRGECALWPPHSALFKHIDTRSRATSSHLGLPRHHPGATLQWCAETIPAPNTSCVRAPAGRLLQICHGQSRRWASSLVGDDAVKSDNIIMPSSSS